MTGRSVWDELVGQPKPARFLRKVAAEGTVSHAYLFAGPTGSGKKNAARAFACALMCDDGGCGDCAACRRVRRGTHPDVHVVAPEGAATYVVEQVRELTHDISLRPVEAKLKIYILEQVESFNPSSANAFLKTLEEPPANVVMILLAANYESVLPTIASRCQVVRFGRVPPSRAVAALAQSAAVSEEQALAALGASGWVVPLAAEFLRSPARRRAREETLRVMRGLCDMDPLDVMRAARELVEGSKLSLRDVKKAQAEELAERKEFFGKKWSPKDLEEKHKRELTAREREGLLEVFAVMESWLRDCLLTAQGADDLTMNRDELDAVAALVPLSPGDAVRALRSVQETRRLISYNVNPLLAVEAALFQVQEVLVCPR